MMNMQGPQQGMPQGMGMPPGGVAGLMNAPAPKQGAGVQALVPPLEGLKYQQLLMRLQNPGPTDSSWAIMTAMADALKKEQAAKAMAGQQAMQANAQQGPATVKDQLAMQAAQMAQQEQSPVEDSGIAQGFASGGFVQTFANGSDEEGLRQKIRDKFAREASPLNILGPKAEQERQRAQDILRMLPMLDKEQMLNILGMTQRMADPSAYQDFGPGERMEKMAPPVSVPFGRGMAAAAAQPTTFDLSGLEQAQKALALATKLGAPENERQDILRRIAMMEGQAAAPRGLTSSATQTATPPTAGISPEMESYFRNKASELRTRQGLPEDVLAGRAGIAALARENLAAQRGEAETFGREAREQRDAALARAQRSLFNDPQALFALAGSMSGEKGRTFSDLGKELSTQMGQRQAFAEAARKEYATAQQTERMLQANVRQSSMLEAQREQALRERDFDRANQIKDQIDALMMQRETLLMERGDKAREQARLERGVDAQVFAATKPGETLSLLKELFPGQAPSVENLARLRSAYSPTAGERQDTTELKILQGNLQKQVDNILLPKAQRDAAAIQLERVNAKLAEMAGLGGPAAGASNDPLGIRK